MDIHNMDNIIKILMSNYFKRKRRECGLTGKEMGQLLCVSQQHISRYERRESIIPLNVMVFFLNSKNFDLGEFFNYLLEGIYTLQKKINNDKCNLLSNDFLH